MEDKEPRPDIFLYTDEADLAEDVRAAMVKAGYLPVRVASLESVRIMRAPLSVRAADMDLITACALETIDHYSGSNEVPGTFGQKLAKALLDRRATKPQ